jgi:hypothetical protein
MPCEAFLLIAAAHGRSWRRDGPTGGIGDGEHEVRGTTMAGHGQGHRGGSGHGLYSCEQFQGSESQANRFFQIPPDLVVHL